MDGKLLSTDNLNGRDRLPFWRDLVCDTFVELECDSAERDQFSGSMANSEIADIQFSYVKSVAQHVRRTRSKISHSDHDYYLLSLQTQGQGHLTQDGRTAILKPGDFALYDTTRPYDLKFDDDFGQLVLRLPRPIVVGRLAEVDRLTACRVMGDRGAGMLASQFLRQLHAQLEKIDELSVTRLHASAVDLLATALAEQTGANAHITESQVLIQRRICAYIDRNLGDPRLNCEAIASAHGISERYLRKIFETSTMPVSEWIWSRRLDQAKRDLGDPLRSHISVTSIGYDVGFKDAAHFSRSFRAKFGETPSTCRAHARVERDALQSKS
jgi:AraC-like DNA-binding protein